MSRRPQLSRQVPADSVQKFNSWCENEGHVNGGDKGRHAEQAIIEYLPPEHRPERFRDDLDALEEDLRADLDEVGHLHSDSSSNRILTSKSSNETVKLTYRIAEDVQNALEAYVHEVEGKVRGVVGEYVAAALDEYRAGGQAARVRRYYVRLRENVDMISENRIESILEALRENNGDREWYHLEEIGIAVDDALDVHSNDVRADFVDRAIDGLGFVSVETADGLYATPEMAEQLVQEHEIDADTEWYLMNKDERAEYLTKVVKARSRQSGKGAGVDYKQVRDEIAGQEHSNDYCYELMELAGEFPGFTYGSHNRKLMLRYVGEGEPLPLVAAEDWQSEAQELLKDFCDSHGMDPADLGQPIMDNRIARAKYPEEYVRAEEAEGIYADDVGVSERALEAITETDRNKIWSSMVDDESQIRTGVQNEMNRITVESELATDGGLSNK